MIFNIIGLVIGIMILGAGIYYFAKNKEDKESRKIYGIVIGVGAVIVIGIGIKMIIG